MESAEMAEMTSAGEASSLHEHHEEHYHLYAVEKREVNNTHTTTTQRGEHLLFPSFFSRSCGSIAVSLLSLSDFIHSYGGHGKKTRREREEKQSSSSLLPLFLSSSLFSSLSSNVTLFCILLSLQTDNRFLWWGYKREREREIVEIEQWHSLSFFKSFAHRLFILP